MSIVTFTEAFLTAADSTFAERLAYVRWLRGRGRTALETDAELATALGVTAGWIAKWKVRPDAPEGRTQTTAIAKALRPAGITIDWLFDNRGAAPEPDQWEVWLEARKRPHSRRAPVDQATVDQERQATRERTTARSGRDARHGK